jgi:hypothetical protein
MDSFNHTKEGPASKPNSSRSSTCQEQNSFTSAHWPPFWNQHVFERVWPPSILLGHDQHMTCMTVWNKDVSMGQQNTWNLSLHMTAQCKLFRNIIKRLWQLGITLFRFITVFCGTDNIMYNIPHIHIGVYQGLYNGCDCLERANALGLNHTRACCLLHVVNMVE